MIKENKFICERCNKEFKTSQGLGGHKAAFHNVGLDELNSVLKGETSTDEALANLKGYKESLEQVKRNMESCEEYEGIILTLAILTTLIIFLPKLESLRENN
jgi:hypothetical protein